MYYGVKAPRTKGENPSRPLEYIYRGIGAVEPKNSREAI
jgi:hypothetical protein